jgi:hypothetical protein
VALVLAQIGYDLDGEVEALAEEGGGRDGLGLITADEECGA